MKNNFLNFIEKNKYWLVFIGSVIVYFTYSILVVEIEIQTVIKDWRSWLHTAFVYYLTIVIVNTAINSAMTKGMETEEYKLADEINKKLIKKFNNNAKAFREYVKEINDQELKMVQDNFLLKRRKETVEELTKRERRKFKRLRSFEHDITSFSYPLHVENMSRGRVITYKATIKSGKTRRLITQLFNAVIFSYITFNSFVGVEKVGDAFVSLCVMLSGLSLTFIFVYSPIYYQCKYSLPIMVLNKKTLFDSFEEQKGI